MPLTDKQMALIKAARIHIATPCYGGMLTAQYTMSLLQTLHLLRDLGAAVVINLIRNEALVTRGRNTLVGKFIKDKDATHLMFIDADIEWHPEAIVRLLCHDKPVSGGAYPMKSLNWKTIKNAAKSGKENLDHFASTYVLNFTVAEKELDKESDLVEVRDLGTGFLMIQRKVIEDMQENNPDLRFRNQPYIRDGEDLDEYSYRLFDTKVDPDTQYYLSEDYAFCRRLQMMGGTIFLDRQIQLNHVGSYVFEGNVNAIWDFHED